MAAAKLSSRPAMPGRACAVGRSFAVSAGRSAAAARRSCSGTSQPSQLARDEIAAGVAGDDDAVELLFRQVALQQQARQAVETGP